MVRQDHHKRRFTGLFAPSSSKYRRATLLSIRLLQSTSSTNLRATESSIRKKLDDALRVALINWQLGTRQTLRPWLRGYCAEFAKIIAQFLGEPAMLASVLANDGNVHHIVAIVGNLIIDARGVNTKDSLIAKIDHAAKAQGDPLIAVDIIPFEPEHILLFKTCSAKCAKILARYLNTPDMHQARDLVRTDYYCAPRPSYPSGRCGKSSANMLS